MVVFLWFPFAVGIKYSVCVLLFFSGYYLKSVGVVVSRNQKKSHNLCIHCVLPCPVGDVGETIGEQETIGE